MKTSSVMVAVSAACMLWSCPAAASTTEVESAVVKVFSYQDQPNLTLPWQTLGVSRASGSGVIIEGRRILTNAHVVEDAVSIEVKRADGSDRFEAEVTFVSHDADLALLTVGDAGFFDGAQPLSLGDLPGLAQPVVAYGFPVGGETLSITSGIVSRIEVGTYVQSGRALLLAQIDAAVNPGNSGGPVLADGKVAGIAMQTQTDADNVGYMVPTPVIRHFLEDIADGRYDGIPRLGVFMQSMESESQRRSRGMADGQTGGLVLRTDANAPADGPLRAGDVLLAIDGRPVANDLSVPWPGLGRVHLALVHQSRQVGDFVTATIMRDGKIEEAVLELARSLPLVPWRRTTERPRYLIFGGVVFQPLSADYFDFWEQAPSHLKRFIDEGAAVSQDRREVVFLQRVLPAPVNRGYQDVSDEVVCRVEGVRPADMNHMADLIDAASGPWLEVELCSGDLLTMDVADAKASAADILDWYDISQERYLGE